ncbi:MAG: lycopene cyclase family protein [Bacteroidota bacterium]
MYSKNDQNLQNSYDYIIAGGGMAGLSLAFYLNQSNLRDKSILIIDRDVKDTNDHTWCFWEKGQSPFEEIIAQKWKGVWFHGTDNFSQFLDIQEYTYKMIRGVDFYNYVIPLLKQNENIAFLQADILEVSETVKTNKGDFYASDLVFDSSFRSKYNNSDYHNMLQHFKGWVIETTKPVFKVNEPTLFDFRTEQKNECRFVYVLPHSETKALIEFTIFSDNLIEESEYESYLKKYIEETLKVGEYQIIETEFGIVPMSDEPHEISPKPKVIRIGTSGGYVKASTGYSFQRSQRFLQRLVKSMERNIDIKNGMIPNRWKGFLDTVLLNVMLKNRTPQDDIFTRLFKYNQPSQVLKFLDEDTSIFEDIALIHTVPKPPFMKAAWSILRKKLF